MRSLFYILIITVIWVILSSFTDFCFDHGCGSLMNFNTSSEGIGDFIVHDLKIGRRFVLSFVTVSLSVMLLRKFAKKTSD